VALPIPVKGLDPLSCNTRAAPSKLAGWKMRAVSRIAPWRTLSGDQPQLAATLAASLLNGGTHSSAKEHTPTARENPPACLGGIIVCNFYSLYID